MENSMKNSVFMPVLALRGLVVFPDMHLHFDVGRQKSVNALKRAMDSDQNIFLVMQKDLSIENPEQGDLCKIGCVAKIRQIIRLADDNVRVLIEGKYRASFSNLDTVRNCLMADISRVYDLVTPKKRSYTESALRKVKAEFERFASLSPKMPKDILYTVVSNDDPASLSDFISSNVHFKPEDKQLILEELNLLKRLRLISGLLSLESDIIEVDNRINDKAKEFIDENQKEYYLKEQLHAISNELYGDDGIEAEIDGYNTKIEKLNAPQEAKDVMKEEVRKLFKMPAGSQEAAVVRNYLDLLVSLPFGVYTKTSTDIEKAVKLLNKEHYGLSEVKDRFVEIMAVLKLNPNYKGQIICLVGPPGVGKTSIAHSLSKAMGRSFARVSLGGVSDEAEINGHRRTYIGAMPGRIIKAIKQSGSANPLILLDEIDKMTVSNHGDPAASLLEVLDREQNFAYVDKYVDMPFDLSKAVFLCTANNADNIPAPLYDRMDIITLPGYTRSDKFNIAHNHLIKKQMNECGLTSKNFKIDRAAVYSIIDFYTREAGVRSLERSFSQIMRKASKQIVSGGDLVRITAGNLKDYLGVPKFKDETIIKEDTIGVVNGLAYTSVGGTMLEIEASAVDGSGKIELTGSLGEVMVESAKAAISYIRKNAEKLGIDPQFYKNKDIHIHATEAATKKDGPSAGVSMVTATVSALSGKKIRHDVAMTGEISILGRVFAIGAVKEKTMAAYANGIKTVILPEDNRPDIEIIDDEVKNGLRFCFAETVDDVLRVALLSQDNQKDYTSMAKTVENNMGLRA